MGKYTTPTLRNCSLSVLLIALLLVSADSFSSLMFHPEFPEEHPLHVFCLTLCIRLVQVTDNYSAHQEIPCYWSWREQNSITGPHHEPDQHRS